MRVPDARDVLIPLALRVPLDTSPRGVLLAEELAAATDDDDTARLARELDRELVASALVVPYAGVSRTLLLSARLDAANCLRVHPVYGVDLSSLCVR
jgi:hypothetical protein